MQGIYYFIFRHEHTSQTMPPKFKRLALNQLHLEPQEDTEYRCVLHALNNVLQLFGSRRVTPKDFEDIVTEFTNKHSHIFNYFLSTQLSDPNTDPNCKECKQENWSLSVPFEWLKKRKFACNEITGNLLDEAMRPGRYFIYSFIEDGQSAHAIAIIDGCLLDSLKRTGPINLRMPENMEMFKKEYQVARVWEIMPTGS